MPPADPTTQDQPESTGPDEPDSSRTPAPTPIAIDLVIHTDEPDPPITGWLEPRLKQAIAHTGLTQAQLTLVVVEDAEMAQLHEQYTGVAGTTDVLTFDLSDPPNTADDAEVQSVEGDIVLCLDEAKRQADARAHPVRHEVLLYAIHGLLHLLGEDDHDEADYQRMHRREDQLLEQLGLGAVFNRDANTNKGGAGVPPDNPQSPRQD